jgi:hypothetical protein
MQANDVGILLQFNPLMPNDQNGLTDFTNCTSATLVAIDPNKVRRTFTLAVADDGSQATYTTLAGDFPLNGTYEMQIVATYTTFGPIACKPFDFVVGEEL